MAVPSQLVGQTLGHYRIIEQIGAGGMGVVYRARDERLERDVAIKVLPTGALADESARRRFRKEALTLSKLSHPNIATVHDFDSQNGLDFLVTEYIAGVTLDAKLAGGVLPEKEVIRLGTQLSEGLNAAHQHDIVHRDLKPANLRLTPDGRLKILDFGLAQLMPHASEMGLTATLTQSQQVTGTLPYMAPEQLRGEPAEARTDIWAAGAVLYEMATAHRPFEQKIPGALTDDIIHRAPPPPCRLRSDLSSKLEAVILKCLEKEPAKRYQSARELQADLERLSTGASPRAAGRRLWPIIAASAIVVVMLAVGAFFYLHRSPKLTEKDTIVLADFTNTTGDPVFDGTLRQGLAVQLEQSPFLMPVSEQRIQQALGFMNRPKETPLTAQVAREVCERTSSAAVLEGSIASLGNQYVLGLRARSCRTGDSLGEEQAQAASKEEVLNALTRVAVQIRKRLGESLATIQEHSTPLEEATTASLEALKAYSLGRIALFAHGGTAALSHFQRAIAIDPQFALAYADLSINYWNMGQTDLAAEYTRKAYQLRDRVSDRERLWILFLYDRQVTGNLVRELQTLESWVQAYPRDYLPYSVLGGWGTRGTGQYERGLQALEESLRLNPDNPFAYEGLAIHNISLNRFAEAADALRRAAARNMDLPEFFPTLRYYLAFFADDEAGMEREIAGARGKAGAEDLMLHNQALVLARSGRMRQAREMWQRAVALAEQTGDRERPALYQAATAVCEAQFGSAVAAKKRAEAALQVAKSRDVEYAAAFALALAGDSAKSQSLADDLAKRFPEDTPVQFEYLPTLRALAALAHREPAGALEQLQVALSYDLAMPGTAFVAKFGGLYPAYVRGQAYLESRRSQEAAAEFQKILDHRGIVFADPVGALAHLRLGRAYLLGGDVGKAKSAYQAFLTLWKDADPDIPILKQAKAEYAKLQ